MSQREKLAFLGIGLMGLPMCHRLLDAGFDLTVWNRTAEKAAPLVKRGAKQAGTPTEAVTDADVILVMLETGQAVEEVLFASGAAHSIKPDALVLDMGSIPPATARTHSARLQKRGVEHLDAPVSGGTPGAEQGTLSFMVGGSQASFERAQPLFAAMGRTATRIGDSGAGQVAKCANQAIVGITIGAVAEALTLAEQAGADPVATRAALLGGFAQSRVLDLHGQKMLERAFEPGATCRVQLKDMNTILDCAREAGLQLPLAEKVQGMYQSLIERGGEGYDHSALKIELEHLNNLTT